METLSTRLRRVAGLSVFSVAVVALLIGLGVWQLQRRVEKHALIAALDARLAASPVPLPPASQWGALTPGHDEFRRVTFSATFERRPDARVFTSGSALRPDVIGTGVWLFAPVQTGDATVVVNRGFVADAHQSDITAAPSGPVTLTGYLRFPEHATFLTPHEETAKRLWFLRDQRAMADVLGWGKVAPFYIDLEAPAPANGVPRPGPLEVHLRDAHMQYAITWFGLAAAVAIAFAVWLVRALSGDAVPPASNAGPPTRRTF
jgi:cytochrome oxidase assembly protein ShyY1